MASSSGGIGWLDIMDDRLRLYNERAKEVSLRGQRLTCQLTKVQKRTEAMVMQYVTHADG